MVEIYNNELMAVVGGLSITGSLINAFANCTKTIFEIGQSLGTAIRRIVEGSLCQV